MRSSFFDSLRSMIAQIEAPVFVPVKYDVIELPIHPSASELMEQMLVDPEALKNETYEPGVYDEDGDYYPQFSDDPNSLPDFIEPVSLDAPVGDTVPESAPASDESVPSSDNKDAD